MDIKTRKAIHHLAWLLSDGKGPEYNFDLGASMYRVEAAEFLASNGMGKSDGVWQFTPNNELRAIMEDSSLEEG